MKNLTIKKVALGIVLAGYAASGAFALSATSNNTIIGSAPVITKSTYTGTAAAAAAGDMGVSTALTKLPSNTGSATTPEVGDTFTFTYNLPDDDGDTESATKGTAKNIIVQYSKDSGATYTTIPNTSLTTAAGTVSFVITAAMTGATNIVYLAQAETAYGAPDKGSYASGDITVTGNAGVCTTLPCTPGGGGGSGPFPGPIGSGSLKYGIFASTVTAAAVDVSASSTNNYVTAALTPKLGDSLTLWVWNDSDGNNQITTGSESALAIGTSSGDLENVKWGVKGVADPVKNGNVALASHTDANPAANTLTWTIPTTNPTTGFGLAGYQGYNVDVTFDIKP